MTHTECADCGRELSVEEKTCPKCNDPFASKSCGASTTVIVIVIAIVVLIGFIALTCAGS